MIYDLQKASPIKRLSAFILDAILLVVLVTGFAFVLSGLFDYDSWNQTLMDGYKKYEEQYGISLEITQEELNALPEEEQQVYKDALTALNADEEVITAYNMMVNMVLAIVSLSILLSFLGLELIVPLLFGNGQTVGKKVFGIALMKTNGVKINTISLFIRTVLGKFTIETMIPVLLFMMMLLGTVGMMAPIIIVGILLIQIAMMITSKTNSLIHDSLSHTVAVDLQSQMIFSSEEELIEYKKRTHEEFVSKQDY